MASTRVLHHSKSSVLPPRGTNRHNKGEGHIRSHSLLTKATKQQQPPPAGALEAAHSHHDKSVISQYYGDAAEVELYYRSGKRYMEGLFEVPPAWTSAMAFIKIHHLGAVAAR